MTDKLSLTSQDDLEVVLESEVFIRCVSSYTTYTEKTRSGEHGVTVQFWIMYIDYIDHYHILERAIRTNNNIQHDTYHQPVLFNQSCELLTLVVNVPAGFDEH